MVSFDVVCKAHGATALFFGLVFIFASFGYDLPVIGPAALLGGWNITENEALKFMTLFLAGVMFGIGYFEWVFADHEKTRDIFLRYHVILLTLTLYATFGAAVYWLSWLYATLVALFMIGGFVGNPAGYSSV
jgi:hypothetical protein